MPIRILFVLLVSVNFSAAAHAGRLYTWADEDGLPQYGDSPPPGIRYREKPLATRPARDAGAGDGGLRQGEVDLLRKSRHRDQALLKSRQSAARDYREGKQQCSRMTARYREALQDSSDDRRQHIMQSYRQMQATCN